jgi:hypothetical protein
VLLDSSGNKTGMVKDTVYELNKYPAHKSSFKLEIKWLT